MSVFLGASSPLVVNKSNCKVYVYIVKQNYILDGILFTICKTQLHVSALNVGHLQVVQIKLVRYTCICKGCIGFRRMVYVRDLACMEGGNWLWLIRNHIWTENYAYL